MSRKNMTTVAMAIALLALLVSGGCTKNSETNEPQPSDVTCALGSAIKTTLPQTITATGSLAADKTVMISTRMMGWVNKIHVFEGQSVLKGDPLLNIDDTDLMAKKSQAEAGINEAKAIVANAEKMAERFEKLYADKSVSRQQLDDVLTGRDRALAGLAMAQAGLTEVNVHLSYLSIVAPSDGTISRKMIEEGDMANPGMPLLILESAGNFKVIAHLSEKDISLVKVGDQASLDITSLAGDRFPVTISRVIPSANPGSRTYDVEAIIDSPIANLKSGMFARLVIEIGTREVIVAPLEAIIRRGQLTGVWIVDEQNTAHLRWIRLGHALGQQQEVLSGLNGDETLILSSSTPLTEGDKVVD